MRFPRINLNQTKRFARLGTVVAASALSIGSASAQPLSDAQFVAKANSLAPMPVAAQPLAPVVEETVEIVAPEQTAPQIVKNVVRQAKVTRSAVNVDLESIARCESGGNYTAQNRRSTASGKYQFLDSTWGGYGGFKRAKDAPPEVQDARAKETFAARGARPWAASRGCWGR